MNEEASIRRYMDLTGATEACARSVFMFVCTDETLQTAVNGERSSNPRQLAETWPAEYLPTRTAGSAVGEGYRAPSLNSKFGPAFDNRGAAMNCARS
jgi:hypothetical protein